MKKEAQQFDKEKQRLNDEIKRLNEEVKRLNQLSTPKQKVLANPLPAPAKMASKGNNKLRIV